MPGPNENEPRMPLLEWMIERALRARPGIQYVPLRLSEEDIARIERMRFTGKTDEEREMSRKMAGILRDFRGASPTGKDLAERLSERMNLKVGNWKFGLDKEALGKGLLDAFGLRPWGSELYIDDDLADRLSPLATPDLKPKDLRR